MDHVWDLDDVMGAREIRHRMDAVAAPIATGRLHRSGTHAAPAGGSAPSGSSAPRGGSGLHPILAVEHAAQAVGGFFRHLRDELNTGTPVDADRLRRINRQLGGS